MNVVLKFLFSILAHAAWKRIGGGGAVPPIRLPRKGPVNVPVFTSWQLMAVMWLAKKVWQRFGGDVKTRLVNANNPVVQRVGSYVPDVVGATTSSANPTVSSTVVPDTTPAAVPSHAPASLGPTPAPTVRNRSYDTQRLDEDDSTSLLSSLRNGAPS